MARSESIIDRLNAALESRALIQFRRDDLATGSELGYVLGVGPEFFLLALVGSHIRFDGFQIIRANDVSEIHIPHKHASFVERALALRSEARPADPNIDLSSLPAIIRSASNCAQLITIHREEIDPHVCHIGKMVDITETRLVLKEIDCDANWDEGTEEYDLSEITRVDFGCGYETALAMVNNAI